MKTVLAYARLYGDCAAKALKGIQKSPWTLLLPMGLIGVFWLLIPPLSRLGMVGGILLGLLTDVLLSCYLYFTGEIVSNAKVTLAEVRKGLLAYFWAILNLNFVLWIAQFLLQRVLFNNPEARFIQFVVALAGAVLLNVYPETIYLKGTYGGIQTIQRSVQFIQESWIEWFIFLPNLVMPLVLIVPLVWPRYLMLVYTLPLAALVPLAVLFGALVHGVMVTRGHLYQVLDGSSHRQRMFRYRGTP